MKTAEKAKTVALTVAILLLILVIIVALALLGQRRGAGPGFFAQVEARIAAGSGTTEKISLTYFDVPNQGFEPVSAELRGCEGAVGVEITDVRERDSDGAVRSYALDICFRFDKSGVYHASELVLTYPEGSSTHVIGDWCFDVADETETLAVDSYSAVYATSKTDALPYRYIFDDGVSDGDKVYLEYCERHTPALGIENGEISGEVELPESRYALRLIRPRIVVERGGETFYAYPVAACQCGYLDFDEDDFNASRLMALGE